MPGPNQPRPTGVRGVMTPSMTWLARCVMGLALLAATTAPADARTGGVSGAAAPVLCHGLAATIVGTDGPDHLVGTSGPDVIAALGGFDRVEGQGGDDVLCGGDGHNDLFGGPGDDKLFGSDHTNFLSGGPGDDRLVSSGHVMVTLHGGSGDDVERATGTGTLVRLVAEAGHNRVTVSEPRLVEIDLSASRVGVHLDAARGLVDGIGRTRLHLAPGSRLSVHGTRFSDRLVGTGGDDTLVGGDGDDVIDAGAGNDTIQPGPGRNLVQAGRGHDRVVGDPSLRPRGHDVVHAGPGPDLVHVDGSAEVYGGPGADTFGGSLVPGSRERLHGGSGHNRLVVTVPRGQSGHPWDHVVLDLARHRLDADGTRLSFTGLFTDVTVHAVRSATRWTINGTAESDVFTFDHEVADQPVVMRGRGGDDLLLTGGGDDVLWGGPGRDEAAAGQGFDICHSVEAPRSGNPSTECETSTP